MGRALNLIRSPAEMFSSDDIRLTFCASTRLTPLFLNRMKQKANTKLRSDLNSEEGKKAGGFRDGVPQGRREKMEYDGDLQGLLD